MNDVYKFMIAFATAGEFWMNVLHFQNSQTSSSTPEADAGACVTGFVGSCQAALLSVLSVDTTLLGYKCARINNTGGPSYVQPAPSGTTGGLSTPVDNSRVAALFTLDYYNAEGTPPRWRVGKMFLGGVSGTYMVSNSWTTPAITAYKAYLATIEAGFGTSPNNFTTCIWSQKYATAYAGGNWELTPQIAALRRRIQPYL